jgi:hypothetical protein
MAQLSTDTLVYTQIISKVQDFLTRYSTNKFASTKDFDEAYKKLLTEIEKSVGIPSSKIDFFHKGEIPSSTKFNNFSINISNDINIVSNQLDSLVANYVNYFNMITTEVESEKQFMDRIKSKLSVLEMYSESSASNISYFGDALNNLDHVDSRKIPAGLMPSVEGGFASLPKKQLKKNMAKVSVVNQNYNDRQIKDVAFVDISNGLFGNHFLYFDDNANNNPFIYEKDSPVIRTNQNAMVDESPATYFEYEAIDVLQPIQESQQYEFQYRSSNSGVNQNLINWASFDTSQSLKLTVMLQTNSVSGADINYISIVPFFGYDRIDLIKNIKVSSIKLYNEKDNKVFVLFENENIYIGSDIAAPNLSSKNKYFYNKGVFKFENIKANKVFITFEQQSFNNVDIKHTYWKPYETRQLANTPLTSSSWKNQDRFDPRGIVSGDPTIRVEDVSWDSSVVVPFFSKPSEYKSAAQDLRPAIIKYLQQTNKNVDRVKYTGVPNNTYYYYTSKDNLNGCNFRVFTKDKAQALKDGSASSSASTLKTRILEDLSNENAAGRIAIFVDGTENLSEYTSSLKNKIVSSSTSTLVTTFITQQTHGLSVDDYVYINISADYPKQIKMSQITRKKYKVTAVNAGAKSFSVATTAEDYSSVNLDNSFFYKINITFTDANTLVETSSEAESSLSNKSLFLKRNFEYLKAKRAAIGIRDIYVGSEKYTDSCQLVSKPHYIYGSLQMLSLNVDEFLPVERDSAGEIIAKTNIDYYISVDNGASWIDISPIQRSFEGKPEVIAFNQNLSNNAAIPQVAYYNYPEVPKNITSILFKAVMTKDRSCNSTPILYSYKLGVKVI